MARYNQRSVIQAVTTLNTAAGAYSTGDVGATFQKYPSNATPTILPTRAMVQDMAVGDGHAYPLQSKPYYFDSVNIPYAMALNTTMAEMLFRDWLGGAPTNPAAVTGTILQTFAQKAPGTVPLCRNYIDSLGGAAFLFGDCFVEQFGISQSGSAEPQVSATIKNSGHFAKISDTSLDLGDVVAMPAYRKFHGAKTRLTFTDGVTSYTFATDGTLIDVSFTGNQNVLIDQLPGDSFRDDANQCQGAISDNFFIDIQTASITAKIYMDATFAMFATWLSNTILTSIVLSFETCELLGTAGTVLYDILEIDIPKGEFNLQGDANQNFSAYSFNINAIIGDTSSGNLVNGKIRRLTADVLA